jgi:hypothetical protein
MAELEEKGGAIAICSEQPENCGNKERKGAAARCRKLPENGRNGGKVRGCRELPFAARDWQK